VGLYTNRILTPQLKTVSFLLFSLLFGALLYLSLLVTLYGYSAIKDLEDIVYCELGFYRMSISLTETGFWLYRAIVYSSLGVLVLLLTISHQLRLLLNSEIRLLRSEAASTLAAIKGAVGKLTGRSWAIISAIMVATAIAKLYFLLHYPLHTDETATFDYFVMEGIEAVTAYYPIPNNHIFQNLLNLASYRLYPDFIFSVRGTSFLLSTAGLMVLFVLLHVAVNFRTAAAFTLLISAANVPFYFSITGSGYGLLLILTGIGFISVYYILRGQTSSQRLFYLVLALSSIAGLYTVPTYLYTFATYIAILSIGSLARKQYTQLPLVAGLCGVVGVTVVLLYSPVIVISGAKALFANTYVIPQGTAAVFSGLKNYYIQLESSLVGQDRWGYIVSVMLVAVVVLWLWGNKLSQDKKLLCLMALAGSLLPYVFFLLHGVLPPERTVSYKSFYLFLLAAIMADTIIAAYLRNRRAASSAFWLMLVLYFAYEISITFRVMKRLEPAENQIQAMWEQVDRLAPASMYITEPFYQLFFLHYAKLSGSGISFYSTFEREKAYDILILTPDALLPQQVLQQYTNIYSSQELKVYRRKP